MTTKTPMKTTIGKRGAREDPMTQAKKITPAPVEQPWRGVQRVVVEGLVVNCRVGVHAHERERAQRVRIDLETERGEGAEGAGDNIRNVVCYEDLINRVKALVGADHVNLVETLAETIAESICRELPVDRVRVRVCKLDLFDDTELVGAEIERRRQAAEERATPQLRAITGPAGGGRD